MTTLKQIEDAKVWLNEQRQVMTPGPKQTCWDALDVLAAVVRRQEMREQDLQTANCQPSN